MAVQVKATNLTNEGVEVDGYGIDPPVGTFITIGFSDADWLVSKLEFEIAAGMGLISLGTRFIPAEPPLITQEDGYTVVPSTATLNLTGNVDVTSDGTTANVNFPQSIAGLNEYLVGPPESDARFNLPQDANNQMVLDGITENEPGVMILLPGTYVGDFTPSPGVALWGVNGVHFPQPVEAPIPHPIIAGRVTIPDGNTYLFDGIAINNPSGVALLQTGTESGQIIQLFNCDLRGNGALACTIDSAQISNLRAVNCSFTSNDTTPVVDYIERGFATLYGCFLRAGGVATNEVAVNLARGGVFLNDASTIVGQIVTSGDASFSLVFSSATSNPAHSINGSVRSAIINSRVFSFSTPAFEGSGVLDVSTITWTWTGSGFSSSLTMTNTDRAGFTARSSLFTDGATGGLWNQDSSAVLQANSTERGFLPPRMSSLQRINIINPTRGLEVYDLDFGKPFFYNGIEWIQFGDGYYNPAVPGNWAPPLPTTASEALDDLAGIPFPGRVNLSVNNSTVDNYQGVIPTLRSQTGPNLAGAYNGGGTGNKPILAFRGYDNLGLGLLTSIEFSWEDLLPDSPGVSAVALLPFINLIVDINGDGSVIKIFNMSQTLPPTSDTNFTVTNLGLNRYNYDFDPLVNTFEVVLGIAGVTPVINNGPSWFQQAFLMADVLAVYPNAKLVDVDSGDGGMPKDVVTPSVVLAMGGSGNVDAGLKIIEEININGVRQ